MERKRLLITLLVLTVAAGGAVYLLKALRSDNYSQNSMSNNVSRISPAPSAAPSAAYYYPISDYTGRLKIRWYGKYLTAENISEVPCGRVFIGYHTGDDLETTPAEANRQIPVYSIGNGKILQVGHVDGYGGLIVGEYNLAGEQTTVYYGHINLRSALVRPGDLVSPGQKLADLGAACSAQTDGERKHLHFAIHKGPGIDVRGYVPTAGELSSWLNPSAELKTLDAVKD